jgi:hypothetical protein
MSNIILNRFLKAQQCSSLIYFENVIFDLLFVAPSIIVKDDLKSFKYDMHNYCLEDVILKY